MLSFCNTPLCSGGYLESGDSSRSTTATHSRSSSEGVTPPYAVVNQGEDRGWGGDGGQSFMKHYHFSCKLGPVRRSKKAKVFRDAQHGSSALA